MRTARAVDRAPTFIATGFGLFWRLSAMALGFGLFLAFLGLLITYWWVALIVVGVVLFGWVFRTWLQVGREMKKER